MVGSPLRRPPFPHVAQKQAQLGYRQLDHPTAGEHQIEVLPVYLQRQKRQEFATLLEVDASTAHRRDLVDAEPAMDTLFRVEIVVGVMEAGIARLGLAGRGN